LSERSEVTKCNPAFKQKHKIMAGKLSAVRLRRISDFSRGDFPALPAGRLAAAGGEMRSNYFKYSALVVCGKCCKIISDLLQESFAPAISC